MTTETKLPARTYRCQLCGVESTRQNWKDCGNQCPECGTPKDLDTILGSTDTLGGSKR